MGETRKNQEKRHGWRRVRLARTMFRWWKLLALCCELKKSRLPVRGGRGGVSSPSSRVNWVCRHTTDVTFALHHCVCVMSPRRPVTGVGSTRLERELAAHGAMVAAEDLWPARVVGAHELALRARETPPHDAIRPGRHLSGRQRAPLTTWGTPRPRPVSAPL